MSKPVAAIVVNHTLGIVPLGCVFQDVSTGEVTWRVWSFGDGQTSEEKNPHHEYENVGDYHATLTVGNSFGSDSVSVSISVTQTDNPAPMGGERSMMDLVPATRRLLRSPSDLRLHYTAIIETLMDVLRGYTRDLSIADSDEQKDEHVGQMSFIDGDTYLLTVGGAPELEAIALHYSAPAEPFNHSDQFNQDKYWIEVPLVPLNYYADRILRERPIAALFGGLLVDNGTKIRLNMPREKVHAVRWRVTTRLPILQTVTMRSDVNLRSDFLRMLKVEAAIKLMPQIKDDSPTFRQWKADTLPLYMGELAEWRKRWADYLKNNNKPQFAPKIPANEYRYTNTRRRYPVERWKS